MINNYSDKLPKFKFDWKILSLVTRITSTIFRCTNSITTCGACGSIHMGATSKKINGRIYEWCKCMDCKKESYYMTQKLKHKPW